MRYYLDTEFVDDSKTIDLISIGIVAEDGREFYGQSVEFDANQASDWVVHNVFPWLQSCPNGNKVHHSNYHGHCLGHGPCPWYKRPQLAQLIRRFCDPEQYGKAELYGWCSAYDFVVLCQLFGTMMQVPQGWPHYMRDLQQVLDERGISDEELPEQEEGLHHALHDARHLKKLWGYIVRNDCWQ